MIWMALNSNYRIWAYPLAGLKLHSPRSGGAYESAGSDSSLDCTVRIDRAVPQAQARWL